MPRSRFTDLPGKQVLLPTEFSPRTTILPTTARPKWLCHAITLSSRRGTFIGLKGKHNVLIVRESGSKMPADLGGDIYASLRDRNSIAPIERTLAAFMNAI
jgi:hypothetical protein